MQIIDSDNQSGKVNWQGKIVSIQPRTRVWRYLTDNRTHYHLGYLLFLENECDEGNGGDECGEGEKGKRRFSIATSENQQMRMGRFNGILTAI